MKIVNFANKTAQKGFTLVEVMVVIVILSVFAGMMTLSVGSSESRKNLAFYEHLQDNLTYIRLLSVEEMKPYGLAIRLANQDQPTQLVVVKLDNGQTTDEQEQSPAWQLEQRIPALDVPDNVQVDIVPLENIMTEQMPNYLVGNQAPPLVWFGTGEATSVQIMVQKKLPNSETVYPVADPIIINTSGAIQREQ